MAQVNALTTVPPRSECFRPRDHVLVLSLRGDVSRFDAAVLCRASLPGPSDDTLPRGWFLSDFFGTAAHVAARFNNAVAVDVLVAASKGLLDVNAADEVGEHTAIHFAAANGRSVKPRSRGCVCVCVRVCVEWSGAAACAVPV